MIFCLCDRHVWHLGRASAVTGSNETLFFFLFEVCIKCMDVFKFLRSEQDGDSNCVSVSSESVCVCVCVCV